MLDARLAGYDDIAATLGCAPFQVRRYAALGRPATPIEKRYRDPLRLRSLHGHPIILRSELDAWRRRNLAAGTGERKVYGWHHICERIELRRSAANAATALALDPLPVVRPDSGRVWAYESALDEWRNAREFSWATYRALGAPASARRKRWLGAVVASSPAEQREPKSAKLLRSAQSRATGTTRVGVAREHEDHRSQVESAASSPLRFRPLRTTSRSACLRRGGTMRLEL